MLIILIVFNTNRNNFKRVSIGMIHFKHKKKGYTYIKKILKNVL